MTREEAIRWLIRPIVSSTEIGEFKAKELKAYELAIEALSEPKTGWIPVSEKLPKEVNGTVLVTIDRGWKIEVRTAKYSEHSKIWYIGDMCAVGKNTNVTAWMHLPEPYDYGAKTGGKTNEICVYR